MIRVAIALATIVGFANVASGQVVRERIFGAPFTQFGNTVAGIGDVDRDGIADYAVGEPYFSVSSASDEGRVWLYSGASGTLLRVHVGNAGDCLGASVRGAGDVDGDGADDVLVGAPRHSSSNYLEEGLAVVYSGLTGNVIWSVHGGYDFQQVGVSSIRRATSTATGGPKRWVRDRRPISRGWSTPAEPFSTTCSAACSSGHAVAGIDDVDADSRARLPRERIVVHVRDPAAARPSLGLLRSHGDVALLGRRNRRQRLPRTHDPGLGDVDGDTIPDFIAASYVSSQGGNQAGLLRVLSGKDGSTLHQLVGGGRGVVGIRRVRATT